MINCCLCRKKSQSGTNVNFKDFIREETCSALVMPRSFKFLYVASSHSSAVKAGFPISIWPSVQAAVSLFYGLLPPVIWDRSSMLPLALALNRTSRVTSSGQMVSPEWGIRQSCSLQHRKQGLVLSCPPSSIRDGCSDVSQGTGKKGDTGRGNMANLLILPVPFFLSH